MAKLESTLLLVHALALAMGCKTNCEQLSELTDACNEEAGFTADEGLSVECDGSDEDEEIAECIIEEWNTIDCSDTMTIFVDLLTVAAECDPEFAGDTN